MVTTDMCCMAVLALPEEPVPRWPPSRQALRRAGEQVVRMAEGFIHVTSALLQAAEEACNWEPMWACFCRFVRNHLQPLYLFEAYLHRKEGIKLRAHAVMNNATATVSQDSGDPQFEGRGCKSLLPFQVSLQTHFERKLVHKTKLLP